LLKQFINARSIAWQFWNKCCCFFDWPTNYEWTISECNQL